MAHSLSAQKRVRQNAKLRLRNRDRKKIVRVEVKKVTAALAKKDVAEAQSAVNQAIKILDRMAAKKTMHRNTVARRKSRMMRHFNKLKAGA
ncbi:MAG: 30S ribosomal protein S20 [Planctomycetes bacterium]|nr:30S ribosomal protein S20 [Planctomycetota bacterium]